MKQLICMGFHNKIQKIGRLRQLTFIFSKFWSLGFQDGGATVVRIGGPLSLHAAAFSLCLHMVQREGERETASFFLVSFLIRALIPS